MGADGKARGHHGQRGTSRALLALAVLACLVVAAMVFPRQQEGGRSSTVHVSPSMIHADMHSHTTDSDGDFTPEEVISFARARGLTSLWITDHDMIRPLARTQQLLAAAAKAAVSLGFGVEITVGWEGKEHHLLGYFPSTAWAGSQLTPAMQALQVACAKVKQSREDRNQALVGWLNQVLQDPATRSVYFTTPQAEAAYQPIDASVVGEWAREHAALTEVTSLGRPHFRKYLSHVSGVRDDLIFGPRSGNGYGVVLTADDSVVWDADAEGQSGTAVEALLHSGTLGRRDIAFRPLPILDAIAMINDAAGYSVVAHLPTLGKKWRTQFLPKLPELAAGGLWGVEAYSAEISEEAHAEINAVALESGLHTTGGSDSHGTLKPYAHLGDVWRSRLTFRGGDAGAGTSGADSSTATAYPAVKVWQERGPKTSAMLRGGGGAGQP